LRLAIMNSAINGACWVIWPMRGSKALDAAAFLVHQNRRSISDNAPKICNQIFHLLGRVNVTPEQDEAPRQRFAEEGALVRRQPRTRNPGDESTGCHGRGLRPHP